MVSKGVCCPDRHSGGRHHDGFNVGLVAVRSLFPLAIPIQSSVAFSGDRRRCHPVQLVGGRDEEGEKAEGIGGGNTEGRGRCHL